MTTFEIHKGVDAPVEFKGLRSQYLFICAGGLIGAFLIVVVLYCAAWVNSSAWVSVALWPPGS